MIRDLVSKVLPGSTKPEVERLLGESPREEMRRHTLEDLAVRERNPDGTWKPLPRTGTGYYWDEFDWDLCYIIGYVQEFGSKGKWETLLVRFGTNGVFSSWYIDGSASWPRIVGKEGAMTYKRTR